MKRCQSIAAVGPFVWDAELAALACTYYENPLHEAIGDLFDSIIYNGICASVKDIL